MNPTARLQEIFATPPTLRGNLVIHESGADPLERNQDQTNQVFSDKWDRTERLAEVERLYQSQCEWFLQLYGFASEAALADYLRSQPVIIDTGCGLGYKAAWFARLAPQSLVLGLELSESVHLAAKNFPDLPNLFFLQCDIAATPLLPGSVDFVVCDQVIHHTSVPAQTFAHLTALLKQGGQFACYVYRRKALPRELLDDYFRTRTHDIPEAQMWEFSAQMTELGKRLSELKVEIDCPDIPVLGIKGGRYDIQRFLHWNFLKCFWREDWGPDLCTSTNYDWYAPSNAQRYSRQEFEQMVADNQLQVVCFHEEEACYSGRFQK